MINLLDRSALKIKNGIPYFEIPEIAKMEWIHHAFLTRQGGVSLPPYDSLNLDDNALRKNGDREEHVSQNKNLIAMTFGMNPSRLVLLDQIHQDQIFLLRESFNTPPASMEYDAIITNSPNTFLAILTADCLPIFVVDQKRKVIAAVHAGRQGTALHITTKVLKKMEKEFSCLPMDLLILLGPSIGPCCYEIDEKAFLLEWEPFSTPKGEGKWMVDLFQINIAQIEREGIEKEQIFRIDLCTCCHNDLFFSYRKESQTGRQLSFIGMK